MIKIPKSKKYGKLKSIFKDSSPIRPKRTETALYGGKRIGRGNYRSFSETKTLRTFDVNVHEVKLFSEIYEMKFKVKVSASVLRKIDKMGGLDNYILNTPKAQLDSAFGIWLRNKLIKRRIFNKKKENWNESVEYYANLLAEDMKEDPKLANASVQTYVDVSELNEKELRDVNVFSKMIDEKIALHNRMKEKSKKPNPKATGKYVEYRKTNKLYAMESQLSEKQKSELKEEKEKQERKFEVFKKYWKKREPEQLQKELQTMQASVNRAWKQ